MVHTNIIFLYVVDILKKVKKIQRLNDFEQLVTSCGQPQWRFN